MNHLTPDELIDAVEHTLPPERHAHVESCADCRREALQLAGVLREARALDMPEPSPSFWTGFTARVRAAIDADSRVQVQPARWFHWPVLAPIAALAMLVLALVWAVPERPDLAAIQLAGTQPPAGTPDLEDPFNADAQWALMAALVGEIDPASIQEAGIGSAPGSADKMISQLSSDEREELLRLLREELQGSGG